MLDELIEKGWVYRDLPRMSPELFDKFIEIVGDENIKWLTKADYGDSKRGQLMVNPEGLRRAAEYAKANSGASGEGAGL